MSAKKQAPERHQFIVNKLLQSYLHPIYAVNADLGMERKKPDPRPKKEQSRAAPASEEEPEESAASAEC